MIRLFLESKREELEAELLETGVKALESSLSSDFMGFSEFHGALEELDEIVGLCVGGAEPSMEELVERKIAYGRESALLTIKVITNGKSELAKEANTELVFKISELRGRMRIISEVMEELRREGDKNEN